MEKGYNVYNLIDSFRKWLIAEKISKGKKPSKATLKNYVSDLKHFLGWSILKVKSQKLEVKSQEIEVRNQKLKDSQIPELINLFNQSFIEEYKQYLVSNNIPLNTVNRRLSTLRKFFSFCIDQGWIKENPAKKVKNAVSSIKYQVSSRKIDEFKEYLISKKKIPKEQVSKILQDVKEFLLITKSKYQV